MGGNYLYVVWKDKLPTDARNVYRVIGNIDVIDGKFVFQIPNGSIVYVDSEQIISIGVSGNIDLSKYMNRK